MKMVSYFQLSLVILTFALTLFTTGETRTEHSRERKFQSHLIESLLNDKSKSKTFQGFNCLSCLLKLYLDNPKRIKQDLIEAESRKLNSVNTPLSRLFTHSRKTPSGTDHSLENPDAFSRDLATSREDDAEEWPSSRFTSKHTNNYLSYDDYKTDELEDSYYDDLPNNLDSLYSARSDYDAYDGEEMDYRDYISDSHVEMCKTQKTWKFLNETRNQRGEIVTVLRDTHEGRPQFVYVYECVENECERCRGLRRNSRCRMRESYLNLYHEVNGKRQYGYVVVPTHCTCELLPRNFQKEGCPVRGKRDKIKK